MSKTEAKDILKLPPGGGIWSFITTTGRVTKGKVLEIHDNAVIIETPEGHVGIVVMAHVEMMWEELTAEVK